jgi:putative transcriptional regulator
VLFGNAIKYSNGAALECQGYVSALCFSKLVLSTFSRLTYVTKSVIFLHPSIYIRRYIQHIAKAHGSFGRIKRTTVLFSVKIPNLRYSMDITNLGWEKMRNRVGDYRTDLELTQADLAKLAGVSQRAIGYIENGDREPKVGLAIKLSRIFGTTVEELFIVE